MSTPQRNGQRHKKLETFVSHSKPKTMKGLEESYLKTFFANENKYKIKPLESN